MVQIKPSSIPLRPFDPLPLTDFNFILPEHDPHQVAQAAWMELDDNNDRDKVELENFLLRLQQDPDPDPVDISCLSASARNLLLDTVDEMRTRFVNGRQSCAGHIFCPFRQAVA